MKSQGYILTVEFEVINVAQDVLLLLKVLNPELLKIYLSGYTKRMSHLNRLSREIPETNKNRNWKNIANVISLLLALNLYKLGMKVEAQEFMIESQIDFTSLWDRLVEFGVNMERYKDAYADILEFIKSEKL